MKGLLHKASGSLILSGILSLLFGILSFAWPGITLVTLVWIFAITIIAQGLLQISAAFNHRKGESHWWVLLLIGIINIIGGFVALVYPGITAILLITFMGVTWLFSGILEIIGAIRLRKEINNEGWLILSGIISVLAGLVVLFHPGGGALAMIWLIAAYAIVFGFMLILLGFRARKWGKKVAGAA
ncbi:MAG TPA: DUF308 domain-containing protein [Puia sp.]|nr:DUF308 domain-containing protein [Puia sp.]